MSLKIRLEIDTLDEPIEGYVSNDFGYSLRDLLVEGIRAWRDRCDSLDRKDKIEKLGTEIAEHEIRKTIKEAEQNE